MGDSAEVAEYPAPAHRQSIFGTLSCYGSRAKRASSPWRFSRPEFPLEAPAAAPGHTRVGRHLQCAKHAVFLDDEGERAGNQPGDGCVVVSRQSGQGPVVKIVQTEMNDMPPVSFSAVAVFGNRLLHILHDQSLQVAVVLIRRGRC